MSPGLSSLWFIRLRWFAFVGQLIVLGAALFIFELTVPWLKILALLLLIPVSNLLATTRLTKSLTETELSGCLLAFDTLLVTAILYQAGGPSNPFTIVYLLHVVLAAVMLTNGWTWAIAALSSLSFGALFVSARPIPEWEHHGGHHGLSLHLYGMLFAYVTVAFLVTYFLNRIVGDLRKKERALERLKNSSINQQRLASLTTITAGAAHELGTPLATIAVVTHELERRINNGASESDLLEDVALIKGETERCKGVLRELSEKTGDLMGEAPQAVRVADLIKDATEPLRLNAAFSLHGNVEFVMPKVPRKSLTLAVRALVKNAAEASRTQKSPIEITAAEVDGRMNLEIVDRGTGIDSETLERVGEPFFSSKGAGEGMGLGVYLSRLTVEQLGGSLAIDSVLGRGTRVKLSFPIDCSN